MYHYYYYKISPSLDESNLVGDLIYFEGEGCSRRRGLRPEPRPELWSWSYCAEECWEIVPPQQEVLQIYQGYSEPFRHTPCFARELVAVSYVKSTSCRKPGLSGLMVPACVSTGGCHGDMRGDFLPISTPGDGPWIRGPRTPTVTYGSCGRL